MFNRRRWSCMLGTVLVSLFLSGCGGELSLTERRLDLRNLHTYYVQFCTEKGEPPRGLDDLENLAEFKTYHAAAEGTWNRLADGRYEVVWGVDAADPPGEPGTVKLAWDKNAWPDGTRLVLCADGTIRDVNKTDFDSMPAARPVAEGGLSPR